MEMTIKISMDSDAFQGDTLAELTNVLDRIRAKVASLSYGDDFDGGFPVRDTNGNTVALVTVV